MKILPIQTLLAGALVCAATTATAATVLDGPTHADIGIGWDAGATGSARWDLHVHDETTDTEYEPGDVTLRVNNSAFITSPGGLFDPILGSAGTPNWRLSQVQDPNFLFLGWAAEEVATNLFVGNSVTFELTAISGPGEFAVYFVDGFNVPTAFFNTRDGISSADALTLVAGGHEDLNVAFSAPGTYTVTLEAYGTLVAGNEFTRSDPVDYTFEVIPEPSTYALAGCGLLGLLALRHRRRGQAQESLR